MRWWRGATWRSVLLVALLPVLLSVVGVGIARTGLEAQLRHEARARLAAEMTNFEALYEQRRVIAVRQAMAYRAALDRGRDQIYLLEDRAGRVLAGNLPGWPEGLARPPEGAASVPGELHVPAAVTPQTSARGPYLVAARTLRGGFAMLVGLSLDPMRDTLAQMNRIFAAFGAVMLATGLGAAAVVAIRANRRLERINGFLSRVGQDGDVADRLDAAPADEYGRLARHVNDMLDRIAHLVEAHRRLGNAVAHEMRTPLARIRSQLADLDLDETQYAALDSEIRTMIRLFDSLLSIAEMDARTGNTAGLAAIDLSAVVSDIAALYDPVAEEAERVLESRVQPGLRILGDAGLMAQVLSNLVENGLKYTARGDRITLDLRGDEGHVVLRVSDTGPGISEDLRARIFTPFTRGTGTGLAPGYGLGLALVRAVALRHGARLSLPEQETGFALEIRFLAYID